MPDSTFSVLQHFFASFLSRDEAYGLIIDGWSQHSNGAEIPLDRQVYIVGFFIDWMD